MIIVTVLLDFVTQNHFAFGRTGEGREERDVVLQMLQSLKNETLKFEAIISFGPDPEEDLLSCCCPWQS